MVGSTTEEIKAEADGNLHFLNSAKKFVDAANAFAPILSTIHEDYEAQRFLDWPTIVLATILQTTTISLFRLLPEEHQPQPDALLDRRSIASLLRNIVDTADVIDFLCASIGDKEKWNLHRDIMGYYLSHQIIRSESDPFKGLGPANGLSHTRDASWQKIKRQISDKNILNRLKGGETLVYASRAERLKSACGDDAKFVGSVLGDLSTYVHSVPPRIWLKSISEGFHDTLVSRGVLAVWLLVGSFYYARALKVVLSVTNREDKIPESLKSYLNERKSVFAPKT